MVSATDMGKLGKLIAGVDASKNILEEAVNGQMMAMKTTAKSKTDIKLANKHPGIEVEADTTTSKGTMVCRIFLINGILYQVLCLGANDFPKTADAKKFLDSFELVGE